MTAQTNTLSDELVETVARLQWNLAGAPPEADKCFVSLDDHRALLSGIERIQEEARKRADILSRLANDVEGSFHFAEDAVREAIGNTNYSVIMGWVKEARALPADMGEEDQHA